MGKCLVTKLNGSTGNTELLKVGELRIKVKSAAVPTNKTQGINISSIKALQLSVIGDGYFTDSTLSENNGKSMLLPEHTLKDIFVSNGNFDISINDKYSLDILNLRSSVSESVSDYHYLSLEDLKFCKNLGIINAESKSITGDISALANMNYLTSIKIQDSSVTGDISVVKNLPNLKEIKLYGDFTGDYAAFVGCPNLKNVFLIGTNCNGDISSFANLTNIDTLHLQNGTGDIASLKSLSKLVQFICYGTLSGDLAKMPDATYSLFCSSTSRFTWSNRPTTAYILSINGSPYIENLDAMLINQANCKNLETSVESFKKIIVSGTRTSASDAALATLQQKGYTISVTPA